MTKTTRFYYVTAVAVHPGHLHKSGRVVQGIELPRTPFVSLSDCRRILGDCERNLGVEVDSVSIHDSAWDIEDPDSDPRLISPLKRYDYIKKTNSLVVFENHYPVYANDNGTITRNSAAICDSIG